MRPRIVKFGVGIIATAMTMLAIPRAVALDPEVRPGDTSFTIRNDGSVETGTATVPSSRRQGRTPQATYRTVLVPLCLVGGTSTCAPDTAVACPETGMLAYTVVRIYENGRRVNTGLSCASGATEPDVAAPVEVTSAMVLRALRRVGVPEPVLVVSPPGGRTLVNLETIFSTEVEPFTASVRLVGRRVDVRVEPVGFVWSHGDGTSQRSDFAGRSYAEGVAWSEYLTHAYAVAGVVRAGVSVEYAARFRVDGGRWREVEGTVRVAGEPVELRVVEARPELVSTR